jgi:hypothetical protein
MMMTKVRRRIRPPIVAALLLLSGCPGSSSAPSAQAPAPAPAPAPAKVGEVVKLGGLSLSVLGWREVPPSDSVAPGAGNRFVAVELLIVNDGVNADGMISPELQSGEQHYERDIIVTALIKGNPAPVLQPGERLRTSQGFEVPKTSKDLVFLSGPTVMHRDADARVLLGADPVQVAPPASLGAVTPGPESAAAEVDGIAVTVHGASPVESKNEFVKPDAGQRFVGVELTIENRRSVEAKLSVLMGAHLVEPTGASHDFEAMGGVLFGEERIPPSIELAPGEKKHGKIAFQLPPEATKGLVFKLQTSFPPMGPGLSAKVPDLAEPAPEPPSPAASSGGTAPK